MLHSNDELIKLLSNDDKRRAFANSYKEWGVYAVTPVSNLTFYKYDLPDGTGLIVMEHMQKNYYPSDGEAKWNTATRKYLQKGEYFTPDSVSDTQISDHLKVLKDKLQKEKKEGNCGNVDFAVGQIVRANSMCPEYEGLFGTIIEVRTGNDKETENDFDDIYVNFDIPAGSDRVRKLESDFQKFIADINLDLVIMAPQMLELI